MSGTTEPEVTVTVTGGVEPQSSTADAEGEFEVELQLNTTNTLNIFAVVPETGLTSEPATAVVVHDDVAPDAPSIAPVASPTSAETLTLSGMTEPRATVSVQETEASTTPTELEVSE